MVYYYSNSQELHACEAIVTHTRNSSKKLAKNMKIDIYLGVKLIFKLFAGKVKKKRSSVWSIVLDAGCIITKCVGTLY